MLKSNVIFCGVCEIHDGHHRGTYLNVLLHGKIS